MAKKTATKPAAKTATKSLAALKDEICDIGRRIYNKGFAAGNDGNISYRLGPNKVLCTPTMMSKGFMTPADLCIVDMEGNQVAGKRKRSSEILLHLTIMKERPDVNSVVHCHPPHAYWWTEIVDAYCRILMLAKGLGGIVYLTGQETRALLDLKQKWGYTDARLDLNMNDRDICDNAVFRSTWQEVGVARRAFATHPEVAATAPSSNNGRGLPAGIDYETLVKRITENVCRELGITPGSSSRS